MNIEPAPTKNNKGRLYWEIGTIPAQSAKRIAVTGRAKKLGCLVSSSRARICYEIPLPLAVRVVQCNVDVKTSLPETADLCDEIPLCITAYNVGSAPATNTCITVRLPEGLVSMDGQRDFQIPVGTMPIGAAKTFSAKLRANRKGDFRVSTTIKADRDCQGEAISATKVVGAELELYAAAPGDGYICTDIPYQISVTNKGDSPAKNVCLVDSVSGTFKITNISDSGAFRKGGRVAWNLGTLNPGETKSVSLNGNSATEGQVVSTFSVTAACAQGKTATHKLDLVGVSGVLTSVKDNCDPVQLNGVVTYTVTATNTGSRSDTDLRYTVKLDEGMEFVNGTGVTTVTQSAADTLTFAPLPVLRSGETATWQIRVRAKTQGDKRFTASLVTAQLQTPVAKSESTTFYKQNMKVVVAK
jgi:conserved repeat domain